MKHKTSELTGALLDAAVAKAAGAPFDRLNSAFQNVAWQITRGADEGGKEAAKNVVFDRFAPSEDWSVGGPIIERERIDISSPDPFHDDFDGWYAYLWTGRSAMTVSAKFNQRGATPLIAAMRAYVASKLGDEVDL